ncbi:hypothetical protein GGQ88_000045 [Novosphingobium hassiacum]|uniref:Uncharacterized protein n=1 Tax=Novosphingobium hassiacum TaxID=173676 RepID=A0A7W5ZRS7_9SPHN|nr:hypothetical protein [Novosphingobium hassiacum]MBB3858805.1 hypothetical protein [Novosphingobium hassiacum]
MSARLKAVDLARRLASEHGVSVEQGKQMIMQSLGGVPIGRPSHPSEAEGLVSFTAI